MIENLIILSLITQFVKAVPMLQPNYSSGIFECDKTIYKGPPSTQNPLLRLGNEGLDSTGAVLKPGMYETLLKDNTLLLTQNGQISGRLFVKQLIELPNKAHPSAKTEQLDDNRILVIYRNERIEAKSIIFLP